MTASSIDQTFVKLPKFTPGEYEFVYTLRNIRGTIMVYSKSSVSNQLVKDDSQNVFKQLTHPISITCSASLNQDKTLTSSIHLKANSTIKPKAFVILSNTYGLHKPTEVSGQEEFVSLLVDRGVSYLSNNSESPEVKYTKTRRQTKEVRIGSTLSKPSTLLNRKQERETEPINSNPQDHSKQSESATGGERRSRKMMKDGASFRKGEADSSESDWRLWLNHPGRVIVLSPVQDAQSTLGDGYSTYRVDLKLDANYQHAQVVWISSQGSHSTEVLALQSAEFSPSRRKLELTSSRPANKIEFEQQIIEVTKKHTPDTKTSRSISTSEDLFSVLTYLNSNSAKDLKNWDFLAVWPQLSIKSQLILYDKYASHELHIFLYFKDKEFTEEVVRPHLRNKNKKQFVDFFILEDTQMLKQYLTPFGIAQLDFKSKILLMVHFHSKEPQICYNYIQKLKKQLPELSPAEQDALKERFDSLLEAELEQILITDKYSKKEFIDSFESQRSHAMLKAEYVPQMSGNVSAFNTMGA